MAGPNLTGLDEALRNIENLRQSTINKHVRKALRKAMVPVRDQAKDNAKQIDDPATREKVWRNIKIVSKKNKQNGDLATSVGVGGGAKKGGTAKKGAGGDTWYWRLVELGTSAFPATPFLRKAFEQKKEQATQIFITEVKNGILSELN